MPYHGPKGKHLLFEPRLETRPSIFDPGFHMLAEHSLEGVGCVPEHEIPETQSGFLRLDQCHFSFNANHLLRKVDRISKVTQQVDESLFFGLGAG